MNENVYKTLWSACVDKRRFDFGREDVEELDMNIFTEVNNYIINHCPDYEQLVKAASGMSIKQYKLHRYYYGEVDEVNVARDVMQGKLLHDVGTEVVNRQGRFSVRLKKMLAKQLKQNFLDEKDYCKIATLIGDWSEKQKMTYEFVDKFDWNSGDFGDQDSCYWGSNAAARDTLEHYGSLAIRFWKGKKGCGRAWIAPLMSHVETDGAVVVFNRYGTPRDMQSVVNAILKVSDNAWHAHSVQMHNDGYRGGIIYTNGDSYLITSIPRESVKKVDLKMDMQEGDYARAHIACHNCGDEVDEGNQHYAPDGDILCDDCFYDNCFVCDFCGETYWDHETHWNTDNDETICESCYNRRGYIQCVHCGYALPRDDARETTEGEHVCEDCLCYYSNCKNCDMPIDGHKHIVIDSNRHKVTLCSPCYHDCAYRCSNCGLYIYDPDNAEDRICEDCEAKNEKDQT